MGSRILLILFKEIVANYHLKPIFVLLCFVDLYFTCLLLVYLLLTLSSFLVLFPFSGCSLLDDLAHKTRVREGLLSLSFD